MRTQKTLLQLLRGEQPTEETKKPIRLQACLQSGGQWSMWDYANKNVREAILIRKNYFDYAYKSGKDLICIVNITGNTSMWSGEWNDGVI